MSLEVVDGRHQVLIECPTPGWAPTLDQTREWFRHHAVYISLREPNPVMLRPQVVTVVRVGTAVPAETPLDVYLRILPFKEGDAASREGSPRPYTRAASSSQQSRAPTSHDQP